MPRETDPAFHVPSLVLAVLAAAATCAVSLELVGLLYSGKFAGLLGVLILPVYFLGALITATAFGLPMLLILRALGLLNLWSTLLVGAVLGAATGWISHFDDWVFDVVCWTTAGTLAAWAGRSVWLWSQYRLGAKQLSGEPRRNIMQ
jgi:hypothetical protein